MLSSLAESFLSYIRSISSRLYELFGGFSFWIDALEDLVFVTNSVIFDANENCIQIRFKNQLKISILCFR